MQITSLGVVGSSGQFGAFLIERVKALLPNLIIRGFDVEGASCTFDELIVCDAIIFAVPPKAYEKSLREIVPHTGLGSVIIDICTVKVHTVKILHEVAIGRSFIAMHPMFGPQSYIDQGYSLKGLNVIVCEKQMPEGAYHAFEGFLKNTLELTVTHMTPEQHDAMQAECQLLPQHIGCAFSNAGFEFDKSRIYTVSGRHFFRAMEIVKHDRELFRQASQLNPFWPKVLARYELGDAQHNLDMLSGVAP